MNVYSYDKYHYKMLITNALYVFFKSKHVLLCIKVIVGRSGRHISARLYIYNYIITSYLSICFKHVICLLLVADIYICKSKSYVNRFASSGFYI